MEAKIKLADYLKRIEYQGSVKANLNTLKKIHELHPRFIPYEDIDPLLGIRVNLDPASLQQKLIYDQRGGYCFEQNGLLKLVLEEIGFDVTTLAGRVLWNQPEDKITRRTHMLLLVKTDNLNYISDVGFGGQVMTAPLLLVPDKIQQTPHEPFKLEFKNDHYFLKTLIQNEWKLMYRFTLEAVPQIDYEVANWYTSTHPDSSFVNNLSASRTDTGRRYTLNNTRFTIHYTGKKNDQKTLSSLKEIRETLQDIIGIKLPSSPKLDSVLNDILKRESNH